MDLVQKGEVEGEKGLEEILGGQTLGIGAGDQDRSQMNDIRFQTSDIKKSGTIDPGGIDLGVDHLDSAAFLYLSLSTLHQKNLRSLIWNLISDIILSKAGRSKNEFIRGTADVDYDPSICIRESVNRQSSSVNRK